jgi:hypothetical protein
MRRAARTATYSTRIPEHRSSAPPQAGPRRAVAAGDAICDAAGRTATPQARPRRAVARDQGWAAPFAERRRAAVRARSPAGCCARRAPQPRTRRQAAAPAGGSPRRERRSSTTRCVRFQVFQERGRRIRAKLRARECASRSTGLRHQPETKQLTDDFRIRGPLLWKRSRFEFKPRSAAEAWKTVGKASKHVTEAPERLGRARRDQAADRMPSAFAGS